ncbi:hypothetical protein J6590_075557 [Homalodisca vitripennis]|nr:hypothetical protein J6590_075557 [Homalodisca vitripennis]
MAGFGFRKGKSTVDAIDKLVHEVLLAFESKGFARATLCDLSKAFDCRVRINLLVSGRTNSNGAPHHSLPLLYSGKFSCEGIRSDGTWACWGIRDVGTITREQGYGVAGMMSES